MIATHIGVRSVAGRPSRLLAGDADSDLVEAVRLGDDSAFEELYRRYHHRIAAYVRRMVRDPARAEDLAQDAFFSALRRMRATDAEIAFKPWIFEIARNAAIDHWRRTSRAEEVSVEADEQLRPSDRMRLVGSGGPDSALVEKEQFEHLRGAFDELSDVHTRILVMRELEGMSYREIAEKLELTRASVESALFRARRRLETEYADISEGRRCAAMRTVMARLAEGLHDHRDEGRLARHARRCHTCRRRARELGVEPLAPLSQLRRKVAALLPLPFLTRPAEGAAAGLLPAGTQVGAVLAERAAAIVVAAALAGAGGMALGGGDVLRDERDLAPKPAIERPANHKTTDGPGHASSGREDVAGKPSAREKAAPGEGDRGAAKLPHGPVAPGADGGAAGQGDTGGAGGAGLQLPAVPDGIERGGSSGGSSGGPGLPDAPDLPAGPPASAYDGSPAAPRVDAPQAMPVETPGAERLAAVDTSVALDAVTATGAG